MIWYFRGSPHVHVWVNIQENPAGRRLTARQAAGGLDAAADGAGQAPDRGES